MSAYETFASVYDLFMEQVEYDEWLDHIHAVWEKYGIAPKTILDLGCGTGSILLPLAQEGFDVIGVDLSSEMLTEADHKAMEAGVSVRQRKRRRISGRTITTRKRKSTNIM